MSYVNRHTNSEQGITIQLPTDTDAKRECSGQGYGMGLAPQTLLFLPGKWRAEHP
jgi:hypothetical protein